MKDQINLSSDFWRRVSVVIVAIYLLSAVLLKSLGRGTNENSLSPAVQMLAMQAEVIVGAWLLIGRLRTISWLVASALFVVLTLVSASSALSGHSDCGCFGPVRVNPWITTGFNFTAILFLLFGRPVYTQFSLIWSTVVVGTLSIFSGLVAFLANGILGDKIMANLQGNLVYVSPSVADIGVHPPGTVKTIRNKIFNRSAKPFRVIGGSVSCNCTLVNHLPILVPANEIVEIEIEMKFHGEPGLFAHNYQLFTDLAKQPKLTGIVAGKIASLSH